MARKPMHGLEISVSSLLIIMDGLSALRNLLASTPSLTMLDQYAAKNGNNSLKHCESSSDIAIDFSMKTSKNHRYHSSPSIPTDAFRLMYAAGGVGDYSSDGEWTAASKDDNDNFSPHRSNGVVVINKKKAAFDLWHKRKLSEIEQQCLWPSDDDAGKRRRLGGSSTDREEREGRIQNHLTPADLFQQGQGRSSNEFFDGNFDQNYSRTISSDREERERRVRDDLTPADLVFQQRQGRSSNEFFDGNFDQNNGQSTTTGTENPVPKSGGLFPSNIASASVFRSNRANGENGAPDPFLFIRSNLNDQAAPKFSHVDQEKKSQNYENASYSPSHKLSSKRGSQLQQAAVNRSHGQQDIVSPKLSRHNDAAFYPNIQCILCKEWVCSRNRYMHIESHLQYRPYKCSVCHYDNRKKIFIELHIKKIHKTHQDAEVVYSPDNELEKRAWALAEQCLQHTREVLLKKGEPENNDKTCVDSTGSQTSNSQPQSSHNQLASNSNSGASANSTTDSLLANYEEVFRPNIYNSQRRGKSLLIEKSRQLGLVPDFSQVLQREEKCHLCASHVLRTHNLLEEHVRTHLSRPSYACSFDECSVAHNSKNFIYRHMKEVHRARKPVYDLLYEFLETHCLRRSTGATVQSHHPDLRTEFNKLCRSCFPLYFVDKTSSVTSQRRKVGIAAPISQAIDLSAPKPAKIENVTKSVRNVSLASTSPHAADTTCYGCELGLNLKWFMTKCHNFEINSVGQECRECIECSIALTAQRRSRSNSFSGRLFCSLCVRFVSGDLASAQWHAYRHCWPAPFACPWCDFASHSVRTVRDHIGVAHSSSVVFGDAASLTDKRLIKFQWTNSDWSRAWSATFAQCFEPRGDDNVVVADVNDDVVDSTDDVTRRDVDDVTNDVIADSDDVIKVYGTKDGFVDVTRDAGPANDKNVEICSRIDGEDGCQGDYRAGDVPNGGPYVGTQHPAGHRIRQTCALCSIEVSGDYSALVSHTSKHMNRQSYSCLYCGNEPGNKIVEATKESSVRCHVLQSHSRVPCVIRMDTCKEAVDERNVLLILCFPNLEPKISLQRVAVADESG